MNLLLPMFLYIGGIWILGAYTKSIFKDAKEEFFKEKSFDPVGKAQTSSLAHRIKGKRERGMSLCSLFHSLPAPKRKKSICEDAGQEIRKRGMP